MTTSILNNLLTLCNKNDIKSLQKNITRMARESRLVYFTSPTTRFSYQSCIIGLGFIEYTRWTIKDPSAKDNRSKKVVPPD
jgi:hypothetical protein